MSKILVNYKIIGRLDCYKANSQRASQRALHDHERVTKSKANAPRQKRNHFVSPVKTLKTCRLSKLTKLISAHSRPFQ
jgi:hypothetical protein